MPECAACEMGVDLEEWFNRTCPNGEKDAHYGGWDEINQKSIWICDNSERQKIEISDWWMCCEHLAFSPVSAIQYGKADGFQR